MASGDAPGATSAVDAPPGPEELLRSVDRLASTMIYQALIFPDGRRKFVYLSDSVRRFYGVSPEEAMADESSEAHSCVVRETAATMDGVVSHEEVGERRPRCDSRQPTAGARKLL